MILVSNLNFYELSLPRWPLSPLVNTVTPFRVAPLSEEHERQIGVVITFSLRRVTNPFKNTKFLLLHNFIWSSRWWQKSLNQTRELKAVNCLAFVAHHILFILVKKGSDIEQLIDAGFALSSLSHLETCSLGRTTFFPFQWKDVFEATEMMGHSHWGMRTVKNMVALFQCAFVKLPFIWSSNWWIGQTYSQDVG